MSVLQKKGIRYNLSSLKVDIEDTSYKSNNYFSISNLPEELLSGKNSFSFTPTSNIKPKSVIYVEVLDSNNIPLYYESGKSKTYIYSDSNEDVTISIYVYRNDTAYGIGQMYIVGTTTDNKTVRWSTNVKINPNYITNSTVVFYNPPKINIEENLSLVLNTKQTDKQVLITNTGSVSGYPVYPIAYSNFSNVNINDYNNFDYRIKFTSSFSTSSQEDSRIFTENNLNTDITLYVDKISYASHQNIVTENVDITQSFKIKNVKNNFEIMLDRPFTYTVNGYSQVVNINSAKFVSSYTYIPYITGSGLILDPNGYYDDGVPNPDIFQYIISGMFTGSTPPVGSLTSGSNIIQYVKKGYLKFYLTDLKTFSGQIYRYKIYRKGLNDSGDFSLIDDGILSEQELLTCAETINGFNKDIGYVHNQDFINKYYYTSSLNGYELIYDSSTTLNTMGVYNTLSSSNVSSSDYIIVKNNSSILTQSSGSIYIPYDESSYSNKLGKSYDSNFIHLNANSDYIFNCNLIMEEPVDSTVDAKLEFYLTGSYNSSSNSHIGDNSYINGLGLKLGEYVLKSGKHRIPFFKENYSFLITPNNEYYGTLIIVPKNLSSFSISNISLKTYSEYGYSPDLFIVKIPYKASVKNELCQYKVELFDYDFNSSGMVLDFVTSIDKNGETLISAVSSSYATTSTFSITTYVNLASSSSWASHSLSSSIASTASFLSDRPSSNTQNGYTYTPGRTLLQWGSTPIYMYSGSSSISFPISFSNACFQVLGCIQESGGTVFAKDWTTSSFYIGCSGGLSGTYTSASWWAIGY